VRSTSRQRSGVTVAAVATALELERSAATRRLNTARNRGYLVTLEDKKAKPVRYALDEQPVRRQCYPSAQPSAQIRASTFAKTPEGGF
jgi:DNA-binding IclR family transcriptional regulator